MNEVNVTPEMLKQLQKIELDMLKELDRVCRKCNIRYVIRFGTLLGAVRHKGFIPWDDDVDVGMMREDYEKFLKAAETELDKEKFFLQTYHTDPEYRWFYARILRKGTVFRRIGQDMIKMKRGIFLDIFPCDNMPENSFSKCIYNSKAYLGRKILYSVVGAKCGKNPLKKGIYAILSKVPKDSAFKLMRNTAAKYNSKKTKYVRCLGWGSKKESEGLLAEWFEERKEIEFEGMKVYGPQDYEGYLRFQYGDYMTLPPVSQRVSRHKAVEIKLL